MVDLKHFQKHRIFLLPQQSNKSENKGRTEIWALYLGELLNKDVYELFTAEAWVDGSSKCRKSLEVKGYHWL